MSRLKNFNKPFKFNSPPDNDLVEKLLSLVYRCVREKKYKTMHDEIRIRAEICKLLQAKPTVDIKRLAHLLYISIPPGIPTTLKNMSYEALTKAFEERLRGELDEPK